MKIIPTNSIKTPLESTVTSLELTVNSFKLFSEVINVEWILRGENNFSRRGILKLPPVIIQQWGTDDSVVKNYVLQQLNLIEDPSVGTAGTAGAGS